MVCGNTELQSNYLCSHLEMFLQCVFFTKSSTNNSKMNRKLHRNGWGSFLDPSAPGFSQQWWSMSPCASIRNPQARQQGHPFLLASISCDNTQNITMLDKNYQPALTFSAAKSLCNALIFPFPVSLSTHFGWSANSVTAMSPLPDNFRCVKQHKSLYKSLKTAIGKIFPMEIYFHTDVSIIFSWRKRFLSVEKPKYGLLIRFIYTFSFSTVLNTFRKYDLL